MRKTTNGAGGFAPREVGPEGAAPKGQHTPGPWTNSNGTIMAPAGKVAEAGNPGYDGFAAESEHEAIANARLIAAAPDLLAALTHAEVMLSIMADPADASSVAVRDAARAAIARATGGGK